jgi:hypothetical protein
MAKPFIRNTGHICLNPQRNSIKGTEEARLWLLADLLGVWDKYGDPGARASMSRPPFFGYDPSLKDQRMNHLFFELARPLALRAVSPTGRVQAVGKVFVHIYPSGYVVLSLAIALGQQNLKNLERAHRAIRETSPWRSDGRWVWSSRTAGRDLAGMAKRVRESIYHSLFAERPPSIHEGRWSTALRLVTDLEAEEVTPMLFKGGYELLTLGMGDTYLLSARPGIICGIESFRHKRPALRLFWEIMRIYEFVMLKNSIYDQYRDFLRTEITSLREFRLSALHKIKEEDLLRFSVYDASIPRYLLALDKHTRGLSAYQRRIYSSISRGTGFDERRDKVKELVKEWEEEVAKWEHGLSVLWKKVISPLRALLK